MKINILGSDYNLIESDPEKHPKLGDGVAGYCDHTSKECVIDTSATYNHDPIAVDNLKVTFDHTKRHELIHAFIIESGCEGQYWHCEDMVDWLAAQFPKLERAFRTTDIL